MARITSVEIANNKTEEVLEAMKEQVLTALASIGQEAEGFAKDECPVDTGTLRNSISNYVSEEEKTVYVGTNVKYAPYVEYRDNARHEVGNAHFLRNSVTDHTDYYKEILDAALRQ